MMFVQEKYTYLSVIIACILFPFLFSFYPKIKFYRAWIKFLIPCFFVASFFIIWDILYTYLNVWAFNKKYIVGIFIFNLPIEEVLFFFVIPFSCVFLFFCLNKFINKIENNLFTNWLTYILIIFLFVFGIIYIKQLYTSVTFFLLSLSLIYTYLYKKEVLPIFYLSYTIILIPFMLSNGVLTGGFLNRMVVVYNPQYHIGLRIYTIPFEDIFYGMLLILWNILGFLRK